MAVTTVPQLQTQLARWQDTVDEALTLAMYGDRDTDAGDSGGLVDTCKRIHAGIIAVRNTVVGEKDIAEYNALVKKYQKIWRDMNSGLHVDIDQYKLTDNDLLVWSQDKNNMNDTTKNMELQHATSDIDESFDIASAPNVSKSVRFKDDIVEASPPVRFKPYRDTVDEFMDDNDNGDDSGLDNPAIDMSNKQIFIHNQNQFMYQDDQLDQLHGSVRQQREMSKTINTELSEQFVIMDDLEAGLDASNARLIHSNNRLTKYRNALKKRGDWMCILILLFILLFLLAIL